MMAVTDLFEMITLVESLLCKLVRRTCIDINFAMFSPIVMRESSATLDRFISLRGDKYPFLLIDLDLTSVGVFETLILHLMHVHLDVHLELVAAAPRLSHLVVVLWDL